MKASLRARFAGLCGLAFLGAGSVVLALLTVMARATLQPRGALLHPGYVDLPNGEHMRPGSYEYWIAAGRTTQVQRIYQRDTVNNLLTFGWIIVLVGLVLAMAAGWLLAPRAVRPLRGLIDEAKKAALSLTPGDSVGYTGPRDEVGELAEAFDLILERSSRAFEGQRRFVANASHELRTPLAINRTLVDVAVRRPDASDDLKRLGESLLVVNTRHERLVEGLLALADSEQPVADRRPFDLVDVVEHVLDTTTPEIGKRDVTVHRLLQPTATLGDPVLVERLVQNLVENGLRHNHQGGELWVITKPRGEVAELVVANTGAPVPEYEVETIFEPFRRLNGDRLRSERGSGLGLSIVRAVADAHGGNVTATPRDEGGLTMTVELPGG